MLLLLGCRSNEEIVDSNAAMNEKIGAFARFEAAKSSSKLVRNTYAVPFAEIIRNFMAKNSSYKNEFEMNFGKIDLDVSSQDFGTDEKIVIFPIIKNNKVEFLLLCKINGDRTFASFVIGTKANSTIRSIIDQFQLHYDRKASARAIEEVVITVVVNNYYQCDIGPIWNGCVSEGGYAGVNTMDGGAYVHGGSGSSGAPEVPTANQNIIDALDGYPCAQDLLRQIPNANNEIAKSINDLFGTSEKIDLTFKPKAGMGNVDGETKVGIVKEFGTFKATIFINEDILNYGTKEYILVTMFHEALHAYLDYELWNLGKEKFEANYPSIYVSSETTQNGTINSYNFLENHQTFGFYLQDLKNVISSFNPSLSADVVTALAKTGVTTTTMSEQQKNANERDVRLNNFSGTKCP